MPFFTPRSPTSPPGIRRAPLVVALLVASVSSIGCGTTGSIGEAPEGAAVERESDVGTGNDTAGESRVGAGEDAPSADAAADVVASDTADSGTEVDGGADANAGGGEVGDDGDVADAGPATDADDGGDVGDAADAAAAEEADVGDAGGAVIALSVGAFHACVLKAGGLKCWGDDSYGQLGDGTAAVTRTKPVAVTGLSSGVIAMSAGGYHTCAVLSSGALKCWGDNNYGQLGDGTTTYRTTPVAVDGLASGVVAVSGGLRHTCALLASGGVKCWGENEYGALGDGTTTRRKGPVDVVGLASGVASVSAGSLRTCVVLGTGGAKCWGWNFKGQVGDGTTIDQWKPVNVVGLARGVAAVSAGHMHTCARLEAGGVRCWGSNEHGDLGDGTLTDRSSPVVVTGVTSATSIGAFSHSCAVVGAGAVKCWGRNERGQVGDGTTTDRWTPTDVSGLAKGVMTVGTGSDHACARLGSGSVMCWGENSSGQLGDGTATRRLTPVAVKGL